MMNNEFVFYRFGYKRRFCDCLSFGRRRSELSYLAVVHNTLITDYNKKPLKYHRERSFSKAYSIILLASYRHILPF